MGLDQYGFAVKAHPKNTDLVIGWNYEEAEPTGDEVKLITQWRKHANLQGYMEDIYFYKAEKAGVETDVFNCQPIRLDAQDLEDLRSYIVEEGLPFATGFFWGETLPEDELQTLDFVEQALSYITQGYEIYYDSWW